MERSVCGCRSPRVSRHPPQRLAVQRLDGDEVALVLQKSEVVDGDERARVEMGLQRPREDAQGEACALATRALGLEPCTQKLEAQRVAVLVLALAAAVGRVVLWARAPPFFEAVLVDQLGGAAAGARLHERAVVYALPAKPAPLFIHLVLPP